MEEERVNPVAQGSEPALHAVRRCHTATTHRVQVHDPACVTLYVIPVS